MKMRALLHLCVALAVLLSIVQCDRHGHGHGHDHSHGRGHSHSHGKGHEHHTNGSLKIYQENLDFAFHLYKHISAQPNSQSKNVFSPH
uniref:Uncharacterized protein n=1 Tax=Anguilla anguilla TaxID=7936 RepID=A0A0E9UWM2_ANGAN